MFTKKNAREMNKRRTDKYRLKKKNGKEHCDKMREYQSEQLPICMELSHIIHSLSVDEESSHETEPKIQPHSAKQQHPTKQIYNCDVSNMSKRTQNIYKHTLNAFENTYQQQSQSQSEMEQQMLTFMTTENRPHSAISVKEKIDSNNNMNVVAIQSYLEKLTLNEYLQNKKFSNGDILYWKSQIDLDSANCNWFTLLVDAANKKNISEQNSTTDPWSLL